MAARSEKTADEPPATAEEALRQVDRYERELEALYGPLGPARAMGQPSEEGLGVTSAAGGTPSEPVTPAPQPAPEPGADPVGGVAEADADDEDEDESTEQLGYGSGGRRCHVACRALSSMRRATDRLCSLAGEADDRCVEARTRVSVAAARVEADCEECAP